MVNDDRDDDAPQPRLVVDPTTGRPILLAPQRQKRPMLTTRSEGRCPFCRGHEAETPPELFALRREGSAADDPDWTVRVVPNKYPANDHHEVVAEGARHHEQPGDLDVGLWCQIAAVWQRRIAALEARPGIALAYLFKNVGPAAGASIPHGHSQLLGLDRIPPRLELERQHAARAAACPWCATLATADRDGRLIRRDTAHVVLAPDPPKLPYETWLLPTRCDDDFLTTDLDSLARSLHALFTAFRDALHRPALNLWLHRIPGARFHWHFEFQPRTGQLAGLELGGDMYINSIPAAPAAALLRAALPPSPTAASPH